MFRSLFTSEGVRGPFSNEMTKDFIEIDAREANKGFELWKSEWVMVSDEDPEFVLYLTQEEFDHLTQASNFGAFR